MLASSFAVGAVVIAAVGLVDAGAVGAPASTVFFAGWCSIGAQPGLNAMSATFYPTYLRSTGIGWALGFARFGGVVGPLDRRRAAAPAVGARPAVPAPRPRRRVIALVGILALSRYFGRQTMASASPVKAV